MTAVENAPHFITQEPNLSPIQDSQVAKKSTGKPSKYCSDFNSLSQKSTDSQTSSSQNSGPLFKEDDSLETDDMNDSSDKIVNGNGRMSGDVEDGELLLDDGEVKEGTGGKLLPTEVNEKNGSESPKLGNHINSPNLKMGPTELDTPAESPVSSLEAPEGSPLSTDGPVKEQTKEATAEGTKAPDDNDNSSSNQQEKNYVKDKITDNGVGGQETPMFSDDSNSNSNSVSSRVNKLLISSSDSDRSKIRVSESFKGSLKDIVRKVSTQSESDRESSCSSPKSIGKGNVFENLGLRDESSQESTGEGKTDNKDKADNDSDEPKPNDGDTKSSRDSLEDCDKECENRLLSTGKSEDNLDSDIDESVLDDPDTEAADKEEKVDDPEDKSLSEETKDVKDIKNVDTDIEMKDVSKDDDILKTDDIVIKHDIEMPDDTAAECDRETKTVKSDAAERKDIDKGVKKETDDVKPSSLGVKRSLSPTDAPTAAPKRSKLEEMIGRLSSSVGKKPEDVENMDEDESDTSSDSESSSENDKQITLSTKELNRIIRKRVDVVLKNEKVKVQKRIEELQEQVELWKTQAKELQNQMLELPTKGPRKKSAVKLRRRPPRVDVGVDTNFVRDVSTRNFGQQVDDTKVQAAQYQQGLNSGNKSAPRTPTTPTTTTPARTLLNNSTGQNAITVRNAQMRPIAPHPGKETVRTLLDNQRGAVTSSTASRNVRPNQNSKPTPSAKQLGGCIDLTDDDDKCPPTKQQVNTVKTVVSTSTVLSPVVQAPALRGGAVLLQGGPGGPLVLQPVTQGMRLGQGNVVYASAPATSIVRPGVTVAGQVPQLRPGQQIVLQTPQRAGATTVTRPPPPLKCAPGVQKHPAPLPPTPSSAGTYPKQPPPKPSLKISRVQQGIVLSWNMTLGKVHADITNYQLFAYQETSAAPSTNLWKKVGDVKALPLPMACTLTQFQEGNKYHFAVRAIDTHNRMGPFSDACSIHLAPTS